MQFNYPSLTAMFVSFGRICNHLCVSYLLFIEGNARHAGPFQRLDNVQGLQVRLQTSHDKYTFFDFEDLLLFPLEQSEIQHWRAGIHAIFPHRGFCPRFPLRQPTESTLSCLLSWSDHYTHLLLPLHQYNNL
jgi:hypothetical protein